MKFMKSRMDKALETAKSELLNEIVEKGINTSGYTYGDAKRPVIDGMSYLSSEEGVKIPIFPITFTDMFELYNQSDITRIVISSLTREAFKNGFKVVKKFSYKCTSCKKEFEHITDDGDCDICKGDLRKPDIKDELRCNEILKEKINRNDFQLEDVLREIDRDLNITDNAYLLLIKNYIIDNDTGEIVNDDLKEIIRVSPVNIIKLMSKTGIPCRDDTERPVRMCVIHREKSFVGEEYTNCPECNTVLKPAYAKANMFQLGARNVNMMGDVRPVYYAQDEVFHTSKFVKEFMYGLSPLISLWSKIVSMIWMDKYIHLYYLRQRPPKGLFMVGTKNVPAFQKAWQWTMDKLRHNPHQIIPLAVETGNSKSIAEYIHFDLSLEEMQFREVRDEFRRIIGAHYGVMPVFSGEMSPSGVYNEGLQVAVTTRAVEDTQRVYNHRILPFICEQMGVKDYIIQLERPEDRDIKKDMESQEARVRVAMSMQQLGFKVELDHSGEFKFSKEPENPDSQEGGMDDALGVPDGVEEGSPDERTEQMQGEPDHSHMADGRVQGEPDMDGIWSKDEMVMSALESLKKSWKLKR